MELIYLSQEHLNLLESDPQRFQKVYLDRLSLPPLPEQWESRQWGKQFHLLMQQRELGLPIESFLEANQDFKEAIAPLLVAIPALNSNIPRQAESKQTLLIENYLLTVIYDLLILGDSCAQILDWKTYPKPKDRAKLAQDWQTRLYLFCNA